MAAARFRLFQIVYASAAGAAALGALHRHDQEAPAHQE
jgi:hypothetical protein